MTRYGILLILSGQRSPNEPAQPWEPRSGLGCNRKQPRTLEWLARDHRCIFTSCRYHVSVAMLSVRLQNIRSLLDTRELTLKPLTILVGKNNSGKSTLTRFFPLLRQSVQAQSNTPLLWYGQLVDFGTIREVLSQFSSDNKVRIDVVLPGGTITPLTPRTFLTRRSIFEVVKTVSYGFSLEERDNKTVLSTFHLSLDQDTIEVDVEDDGKIAKITVNRVDYSHLFQRDTDSNRY